jgi:N-acyl homoserine lactone hydrolase
MADLRLYFFECGTIRLKLHDIKMNQGLNEPYRIPVPWFFIQHPKGNVVIDGGNAVECAAQPFEHWGAVAQRAYPEMSVAQGCVQELERLGVEPGSVAYVLQSHLHLDHTGAVGRFPNAVHVVQRTEYEYAFTPDWFAAANYVRKDFDKPGLQWWFLEGSSTDFYDLFGDGVLRLIFTPGHSVGHQSFLVCPPRSGPMLLTGDAAYTLDHWNEKVLPGFLTSAVDAVRSVRKLRQVARQTGAQVVTGHDPEAWPMFKKAPEFYD